MPSAPPEKLQICSYYKRFWERLFEDVLKSWKPLVLSAAITLAAVLFQIYGGMIPRNLTRVGVISICAAYGCALFLYLLVHLVRTPVLLDRDRQSVIDTQAKAIELAQWSPIEEERAALVADKMAKIRLEGRKMVHRLLMHGELPGHNLNVSKADWEGLQHAINLSLVKDRMTPQNQRVFFVNPEFKSALENYFRSHLDEKWKQ